MVDADSHFPECIENLANLTHNFTSGTNAINLCDCENAREYIKPSLISWEIPLDLLWLYSLTMMLALAIVFTNLPIFVGIARDKQMHKMHNIFIAGQAFSDFSLGVILSVNFVGGTFSKEIPGGQLGCDVVGFWIPLSCHSTVFSLALIAHGRYKAIVKNQKYNPTECLRLILFVVWIPSFTLMAIYTVVSEATLACSGYYCNPIWNKYLMPICGFFLIAPTIYIFWAYRKIYLKVAVTQGAVVKTVSISMNRVLQRQKTQNKMTRLMVIMCLSIFLAWTPIYIYFVVRIGDLISNTEQDRGIYILEYGVGLGATLSSLVSPILYVFFTDSLRLTMKFAFFPIQWKRDYELQQKKQGTEVVGATLKATDNSLHEHHQQQQQQQGGQQSRSDSSYGTQNVVSNTSSNWSKVIHMSAPDGSSVVFSQILSSKPGDGGEI